MKRAYYGTSPGGYDIHFDLHRHLVETVPFTESARVLDVGCANGIETYRLGYEHADWSIIGVDIDEKLIEQAKGGMWDKADFENEGTWWNVSSLADCFAADENIMLHKRIPNVTFEVRDYEKSLPDGDFDYIFAYRVGVSGNADAQEILRAKLTPDGSLFTENQILDKEGYARYDESYF